MADRRPLHRNGQVVPEDDQGNAIQYNQSRSALRDRYGTRRIDGSTKISERDQTPSAIFNKAMLKYAGDPNAISKAKNDVASGFSDNFNPRPWSLTAPIPGIASATNPTGNQFSPSMVAQFQQGGAKSGYFETPYGMIGIRGASQASGVPLASPSDIQPNPTPLSFNLYTPSPLNASQLASYLPSNPASAFTPSWKKPAAGQSYVASVLDNVSKWLT